ncbi:MAG: signal peptide peptidase SppA [Myxococcota bacterium]|nr:signal peptide peptidase SppA [Myxococcota bacterium]
MRSARPVVAIALGLCGLTVVAVGRGDPLPTSAEHVASPGRSVASDDTSQAIVNNPANLAWLPAAELRWTWVHCPDAAAKVGCGHAWEAATPLLFGISTGFRLDLVQPPWGATSGVGVGFPYRGYDYVWATWGLASRLGDRASLGISVARSYSQNGYVDGLWGLGAALSWRPNTRLGVSLVARDVNRPSPQRLPVPSRGSLAVLDARYDAALAFRPTGRREVEVGLELQYWQGSDQWTPRATVGVDVPGFGRAFGSIEAAHWPSDERRGVLGTAGLELHFGGLSAGGGVLVGDGLGPNGTVAEYGTISFAGYTQPGIPRPARAVAIRLERTPSTRGHVELLTKLWGLSERSDVDAVTLVVRAEPASSYAHAEEVADALRVLRAHHKKVLCSLEDAGAKSLYVCASADRVVITPSGGVRYAGLQAQYIYLKGLLDKIGVRGDFIRIGPHKTAPEQFTNEHAGAVAAADHQDLLAQQEAVFVRNLATYRHMTEDRVREETLKGPFVATEARTAGLVDGFAYDDELERATRELLGRNVSYAPYESEIPAPSAFAARGKIALLYLDGDIVDGRSQHIPLIDMSLVGSYSMADTVRQLREDSSVRAVVLRIESPGGSSLASDVMWRELLLLARRKPLVVSMGTVAASGGYYVASASKNIFALPLTITGSIGVFYGKADVSGLLDKIGVTVDTYKTTPRADAESAFRGFSPDERRELERKVDQFYDTFLDRVSEGRGMSKEQIDAVGRGRVWTGQQAFERHLIDHLGGLREALASARAAASLPSDTPVVEWPRETESLLGQALQLAGVGEESAHAGLMATALPAALRTLAPLVVYRSDEPQARIEWVEAGGWEGPRANGR